jgi:ribosomal protein S18 acetylase RimI-like enzyme
MTISYRTGALEDAAAIDRVFRTSFCDTFAHLYRPENLEAFLSKFTLDAWRAELGDDRYHFQVSEADGEIIGFVKLGPPELPVQRSGPAIELRQLYILHEWRGQGVARELMDRALAEAKARGGQELYLTVYTENWRARRFYEKYGFVEVGPYKFMVGDQADEDIIMRASL